MNTTTTTAPGRRIQHTKTSLSIHPATLSTRRNATLTSIHTIFQTTSTSTSSILALSTPTPTSDPEIAASSQPSAPKTGFTPLAIACIFAAIACLLILVCFTGFFLRRYKSRRHQRMLEESTAISLATMRTQASRKLESDDKKSVRNVWFETAKG
ncbi:hypothetical protein EJ04DRAFT_269580 [Polyplosphaeria fusca]|uniref:Uncharacterized protein n=1 Tax=Polyplosphaeria fusca TaxID=682080 RepID=A0A9P4QYW3_9PLEO|nr:hypothetical protein EJ04DRAFT_269580 [Polyplosphaeria fusca]